MTQKHHWAQGSGDRNQCSACGLETMFRYPHRTYYLDDPTGSLQPGLWIHSQGEAIVVAQSPPHRRGQPREKAWSWLCPPCPGPGGALGAALIGRMLLLQRLVAERACPACLTRPGIWCKTLFGHPCPELHAGRRPLQAPVVPVCACGALMRKRALWCSGCWWALPEKLRQAVTKVTDKENRRAAVRRALEWVKERSAQRIA